MSNVENLDLSEFSDEQLYKMIVDVEISIPLYRFARFKQLADELNISWSEAVEKCMYEKCDDLLEMFEKNVPDSDDKDSTVD